MYERIAQCSVLSGGCIDKLADSECDHGGLAGTGLSLGYDVATLDDGPNGTLLDGGGLLETVAVDSTEQIVFDAHLVEAQDGLYPLRRLKL